jgi:hypothetical protein
LTSSGRPWASVNKGTLRFPVTGSQPEPFKGCRPTGNVKVENMPKTATITLTYFERFGGGSNDAPDQYRVEKITDSTAFSPGQWLEKRKVTDLCLSKVWKVTILPPHGK